MRIQHNIAALNSHRQLGNNNTAVSKNLEKLSSGYRINRAGDDAAGLAISEKMRAQITGLKTAQKNANDGISLVQTAEGALTEVHSMLNRMVELANQSSNGTYDNDVDRANLQKELDSLKSEIDRISEGTNFNGINLLDGSLGGTNKSGGLTGAPIVNYKGAQAAGVAGTNFSATTATPAASAVYEYDLSAASVTASGQTITIAGETFTVESNGGSGDINLGTGNAAVSGATLANALKTKLDASTGTASLYTWSVDGNKLVATAKTAGAIGGDGPAAAPGNIGGTVTVNATTKTAGVDSSAGLDYFKTDTINVDGTEVKIDWSQLSDADKSALTKNWTATDGTVKVDDAKKAASIIQDTINKAIDNHNAANGTNLQSVKVSVTSANTDTTAKTFEFTSGQKDGNSKLSFTGQTDTVLGKMFGTTAVTAAAPQRSLSIAAGDLNGKFTMKLDDQTVEIDMSSAGLSAASTDGDVTTALNAAINAALTNYDTANGLTGTTATAGKLQAKINSDGAIEFTNTTGKKISFEDKDSGEVAKTLGISTEGKMASSGGLTLQIGDTAESFNKLTVSVDSMSTSSLGIAGINISTQAGASNAVAAIKKAINTVSSTRGDLGAIQNRLEHTINNLSVTTENMTAAESRIRDVDMAEEMMNYTKNNILVQASQAMLAQANQLPQGVLQLLQ